jgi:hypothetical protein
VAWPELSLPVESCGEVAVELRLELSVVLDESLDVVELLSVLVAWSPAWAAMPTARVPTRLAAMSAPVIAAVRFRPWSRFMSHLPISWRLKTTSPMTLSAACAGPEQLL